MVEISWEVNYVNSGHADINIYVLFFAIYNVCFTISLKEMGRSSKVKNRENGGATGEFTVTLMI